RPREAASWRVRPRSTAPCAGSPGSRPRSDGTSDQTVHAPSPLRRRHEVRPCGSSGKCVQRRVKRSERALHLLDAVALDRVALPHVLVALEGHAAFLAGAHLARVVLETLELRELAVVDDDVVADETHIGAALDHAVGDAAAGDLADLGHREDL